MGNGAGGGKTSGKEKVQATRSVGATLPGKECRIAPHKGWSKAEKWVWREICAGRIADFNAREGLDEPLDPNDPYAWNGKRLARQLSPAFLETVLLHDPWRSAIPRQGVRIAGALFADDLDLTNATVKHEVWLDYSRFEREFDLSRGAWSNLLSLEASTFEDTVNMDSLQLATSLFMRAGAVFKGEVNLDSLQVGHDLFLSDKATFKGDVILVGANVGGWLDISDAEFGELDLTGTLIAGELRLGSQVHDRTRWRDGARLVLRNTQAGSVQDRRDHGGRDPENVAWPKELQLDGFIYGRLGGFGGSGDAADMFDRGAGWYIENWLNRDPTYSPQPYEQLAKVLREAGHVDMAHDILFAGRKRARQNSTGLRWLGLTALEWTIGYGIGTRYFRTLWWIVGSTILGAFAFWYGSGRASDPDIFQLVWLSFDQLLPIVELNKYHASLIAEGVLTRGALAYFYVHKLFGWLLASFLIAGFSGLTQK